MDNSRLIDHASGWYDQKGDFKSIHNYLSLKYKKDKYNRAVVLSDLADTPAILENTHIPHGIWV